jgi:type II secretory pathway predicted ATPase ExeA
MYLNHFKLNSKPFAMNPDPAFLYESAQHAAALTMLEFAMESQTPFCLLTGEIGSGKTTLIHRLLRMLRKQVTVGLVSNAQSRFRSIYPWALSALGIVDDDPSDIGQFEALNDFFIREYGQGRRTLLIFDEAQNLSVRTLEELRLLSNVNSEKDVALQIMLIGQPELRRKLERPQLKQFAQRVAVDFHLNALTLPEAGAYVRHRLKVAGGSDPIFDRQAIEVIHERSGGIPRLMNQLCDLSLVYAFAEGVQHVTAKLVAEVLLDQIRGKTSEPVAQPVAAANVATVAKVATTDGTRVSVVANVAKVVTGETRDSVVANVAKVVTGETRDSVVANMAKVATDETRDSVQPRPKRRLLPLYIGQVPPTKGPLPSKKDPLPSKVGQPEPKVDQLHSKKDPLLRKIGPLQPKKDHLQLKKRRLTSVRSWFFFS